METKLVKVENLSRYFGDICAVSDISFDVERGEVMGLLGPNGAGKSTTMKMLTGNLAPSAGQVWINGIDLLDQPKLAKAELGYLPEQPPLYNELTVDEYLAYAARLNRISRTGQGKAVDMAKQRCGLVDVGKRMIANLSKGYQQRVGIAQAIIHSPAVVILDEPTVGLDPIQIREIRSLIRELSNEHSVILSTHILPEVQSICDRVQIIHQGKVVLNDSIDGLQRQMQTSSMIVGFSAPPPIAELETLMAVQTAEVLSDGKIRIHHAPDCSPANAIVEASVAEKWGLQEMTPERMSLEQVFVDITHTEEMGGPEDILENELQEAS